MRSSAVNLVMEMQIRCQKAPIQRILGIDNKINRFCGHALALNVDNGASLDLTLENLAGQLGQIGKRC